MSLKQSSSAPPAARNTGENSPSCWHRERNRNCLRIESTPSDTFLLPYQQFLGAHHARAGDSETLRISFTTHDVTLSGRQLGEIALALQDLAVEWVKPLPERYQGLAHADGAKVTRVEIKAVE